MFLFLFASKYFFWFLLYFISLIVQECVVLFPYIYEFSSFSSVLDFQFLITVFRKGTWYNFNLCKHIKSRGIAYDLYWRTFCVWEERVCCCCQMECSCMSVRSIWSTVLFKPAVSLLMIYLLLKASYWCPPLLLYCYLCLIIFALHA